MRSNSVCGLGIPTTKKTIVTSRTSRAITQPRVMANPLPMVVICTLFSPAVVNLGPDYPT
jgi:hypothetical protein